MSVYNDNSLVGVIIIPAIGGFVGLLLLGPFGFFLGLVIPLVIGAIVQGSENKNDERIAALEQQVEDLTDDTET